MRCVELNRSKLNRGIGLYWIELNKVGQCLAISRNHSPQKTSFKLRSPYSLEKVGIDEMGTGEIYINDVKRRSLRIMELSQLRQQIVACLLKKN